MPQTRPGRSSDFGGDSALDWLRLIRSRRVGPVTFHRLLAEEGSIGAALQALPRIAAEAGVQGYEPCPEGVARAEMAAGRRAGAQLLVFGGPGYPAALMDLPDAPPVLWARGRLDLLARPILSVVGARNASSLGLRMAQRLAGDLGKAGFVIASGLARGIDSAAHEAALDSGSVAVMAGGIDVTYPEENAALATALAEKGCLLTEQPPGLQPQARHFPLRNRIVSGLAQALIVVEAAAKSGSLITARAALDQGREVMAVPGHPMDARAAGCNQLIRDGACLVRGADDILAALPSLGAPAMPARPAAPPPAAAPPATALGRGAAETADLHREILSRMGPSPLAEDMLIRDARLPPAQIAAALVELELAGQIERRAGTVARLS